MAISSRDPRQVIQEFERVTGSYLSQQANNSRRNGPDVSTVELSLTEILHRSEQFYTALMTRPYVYIPAIEGYLNERHQQGIQLHPLKVIFTGFVVGSRNVMPRTMNSQCLSQMYKVVGIVTRLAMPRPSLETLIEYNPRTKAFSSTEYEDPYATLAPRTIKSFIVRQRSVLYQAPSNNPPETVSQGTTQDANGTDPLVREYGLSSFKDVQRILVQDRPGDVPPGRLPRSIPIILCDHLIDCCKSGDCVEVIGVYNPGMHTRTSEPWLKSSSIQNFMLALSVTVVEAIPRRTILTVEDAVIRFLKRCTDIARYRRYADAHRIVSLSSYAHDVLTYSLAPSVYGHELIKRGLVLQLLQGVAREFSRSSRIRGDINILLVGDPGSAKSQLLRVMRHMLPIAVQTTGRGSSGVGLTAAVVIDSATGERRLDPGAAVLADRGLLLIDEFDKVLTDDRALLHEALEQQSVSVSKAGLHCTLNARCSVLAVANPVYGFFNPSRTFAENIALPDSLLSRYDLIYLVRDTTALDDKIAAHVLANHSLGLSLQEHEYQQQQRHALADALAHSAEDWVYAPGDVVTEELLSRRRAALDNAFAFDEFESLLDVSCEQVAAYALQWPDVTTQRTASTQEGNEEEAAIVRQLLESSEAKERIAEERWNTGKLLPHGTSLTEDASSSSKTALSLDALHPNCFLTYSSVIHRSLVDRLATDWNCVAYVVNPARALVSHDFFREIISFCRSFNKTGPYLSEEAREQIAFCYNDLRQRSIGPRSKQPNTPITARVLESLIRLATALTKLSLPPRNVEAEDVLEAYVLMRTSLFNDSEEAVRKEAFFRAKTQSQETTQKRSKRPTPIQQPTNAPSEERYQRFAEFLGEYLQMISSLQIPIRDIQAALDRHCREKGISPYGMEEVTAWIERFVNETNGIFLEGDEIYKI